MTRFIDLPALAQLTQRVGITRLFTELVRELEADFLRWNDFDKSARVASHSELGVIELMPISDARRYAFKYVNGHPGNTRHGMPTVMAFGVLADVATGCPLLLSELTLTTALRTAATSVMAARALARPGSRHMALIGNGAQSEFQALAFHTQLGITELSVYDVDHAATAKLMRNLADVPGLTVRRASSVADAVRGADIVTTVTADKRRANVLTPGMIEPGMHINGVGGDCPGKTEIHPDVLRRAKVFVEYEPQTRIEGDIQQLGADFPVTELWQVLAGQAAGRDSAEQVTVFDSVGFALEDYSALRLVHALALEHGIGVDVDLVPSGGEDPKDLFRYTRAAAAASSHLQARTIAPLRRVA
jgi:ornithine cyclodeaminase